MIVRTLAIGGKLSMVLHPGSSVPFPFANDLVLLVSG